MLFRIPPINRVVAIIITSDFLVTMGASLLTPIFAIFVTQQISGGSVASVGFAIAIYWGIKSIVQLPIARYLDRNHGEVDDYYFMIIGLISSGVVLASYYFATSVWHVYLLQALLGISDSFLLPPFYAIFTRHIDPGSEGFEWSLRSSLSFGGGAAIGGAIGGLMLGIVGFRNMFVIAAFFNFLSVAVLMFMRPYILPQTLKPVRRALFEQKKV
ncbi:MAG: MFS transporter [Candidatus Sungbacteria bacterium]|nr:MFS transporter [bacterium]MDZ4260574.1 MFS transporter [Candidatus Sungbacteria bacterium]